MPCLAPRCLNVPPTTRQHAPEHLPPRSPLRLDELGMEQQPGPPRLPIVRVMPIQTHPLPTPTTKRLFESIAQCPAGMPLEREPRWPSTQHLPSALWAPAVGGRAHPKYTPWDPSNTSASQFEARQEKHPHPPPHGTQLTLLRPTR